MPLSFFQRVRAEVRQYFLVDTPTLMSAVVPLCLLSIILYTRHPHTNFIFDEQEALLANPYVRFDSETSKGIGWFAAFKRDFWGLLPDRTIGSYRPLPNMLWRLLWLIPQSHHSAFFHHFFLNVWFHGLNGALMVTLVHRWTKRNALAWLTGTLFVASAVITEAVAGVVGIADVLSGTGALLALHALRLPAYAMPFGVFVAMLVGLFSKESALALVPLIPLAAVLTARYIFCSPAEEGRRAIRPRPWLRFVLSAIAVVLAFVFYVEVRRRLFPAKVPDVFSVEANAHKPWAERTYAALLRWYAQPMLPHDALNNPLINASPELRKAGGLRVFARGLWQVICPWTLSGDYSAPQEPIPSRVWFPESVFGLWAMVNGFMAAPALGVFGWLRSQRGYKLEWWALVGLGLTWIVVSYFPVSNIPILLPTVRAERFWYFPVMGSALVMAIVIVRFYDWLSLRKLGAIGVAFGAGLVLFHGVCARKHANDYHNDLVFWNSARKAVPRSAKAHLNYSVMLGARGDLEGRLKSNRIAYELAPDWPMASVYIGDTLCRMHRAEESLPHFIRGFELASNDYLLIALGVQCLWDENLIREETEARTALRTAADKHPGSWLAYLVEDIVLNGETNNGIDPKYRPRSYNAGPK